MRDPRVERVKIVMKQMTVAEAIEKLRAIPLDAQIIVVYDSQMAYESCVDVAYSEDNNEVAFLGLPPGGRIDTEIAAPVEPAPKPRPFLVDDIVHVLRAVRLPDVEEPLGTGIIRQVFAGDRYKIEGFPLLRASRVLRHVD